MTLIYSEILSSGGQLSDSPTVEQSPELANVVRALSRQLAPPCLVYTVKFQSLPCTSFFTVSLRVLT